jgi:hypothetical protein
MARMIKDSYSTGQGSMPWIDPTLLTNVRNSKGMSGAANSSKINSLFQKFANNPGIQGVSKFGQGLVKAAPYIGGGLMAAQGASDLYNMSETKDDVESLRGDIGLLSKNTPLLGNFLDVETENVLNELNRQGNLRKNSGGGAALQGALNELPGAALTALALTLLTGGAGLPLAAAFGAGQLGLGAIGGAKSNVENEENRLRDLYSKLQEAQKMSRQSLSPATQNYNLRPGYLNYM